MKTVLSLFASFLLFNQASALAVNKELTAREIEARTYDCPAPYQAVPLLRAWRQGDEHFYTTNAAEMQNAIQNLGYQAEGNAAKVFTTEQPSTVALYRLDRPDATGQDHFYTTSASERDNAINALGYKSEGTAAYVFATEVCGSIPLYRSFNPAIVDHFYTTSEQEKDSAQGGGWNFEGIAAYVLPA